MTQDLKTPLPSAASSPTAAAKRYLSQLMDHAFREGWRTPDDFVRYFPAHSIMASLKGAPELRVKLLAAATGIYEEILRRKTPALAAEDLRIALEEGTTNSLQLLNVFTPEDRVRYLDPNRIWEFLAEDHFWQLDAEAGEEQRRGAAERMTFTLTQAVTERLLTLRDILDGLTYDAVADSLAPHELRAVVRFAMIKGREGIALNEKVLLEVLPLEKIVRSVPLDHIWREVVIRRLAVPCHFTDLAKEERRSSPVDLRPPSERARSKSNRPSGPPVLPPEYGGPAVGDQMVTALPPAGMRSGYEPGYGEPGYRSADYRAPELAAPVYAAPAYPSPAYAAPAYDAPVYAAPAYEASAYGAPAVAPAFAAGELAANDDLLTAAPPLVAMLRDASILPPPLSRGEPAHSSFLAPDYATAPEEFTRPVQVPLLDAPFDGMGFDSPSFDGGAPPSSAPPSQPTSLRPQIAHNVDAASAESSERQRQRVIEHLRAIGRLPPNHPGLPTPVLRSIDAMYALLPSATDDIQRKSVIRQTFANENHLRSALLGLIELMDSSVDTGDPVIQGAKIEALIKILLFEEQRRKETGRFPTGGYGSGGFASGGYGSGGPGSSGQGSGGYASGRAPLSFPPPSYPSAGYPPPSYPPGSIPPANLPDEYPAPDGYYPSGPASQPPATLLGYPGSAPPLPNLPAEPASSRRRTVPPPLPPTYPRG
ncbi:MAG: hypothetical protein RL685_5906 [Pseudomonadota bacterium]|jgi:uncharacterized membrane protein YgcG